MQKIKNIEFLRIIACILIFAVLVGTFWKHNPQWVYAHPIENVIYTLILVFILGIFTYHFVEAPCAKYLSNKFGK